MEATADLQLWHRHGHQLQLRPTSMCGESCGNFEQKKEQNLDWFLYTNNYKYIHKYYIYIYICVCDYVCVCIYIYVYIYIYMYVCIYHINPNLIILSADPQRWMAVRCRQLWGATSAQLARAGELERVLALERAENQRLRGAVAEAVQFFDIKISGT